MAPKAKIGVKTRAEKAKRPTALQSGVNRTTTEGAETGSQAPASGGRTTQRAQCTKENIVRPQLSARVAQRWQELNARKLKIYYERGFELVPGQYMNHFVKSHVEAWKWEEFVVQPTVKVSYQLVYDFVANFPDEELPTTVRMRGVDVDISPARISQVLSLAGDEYDWYTKFFADRHIPEVHSQIAKTLTNNPKAIWDSDKMKTGDLTKEAQVWAKFVRCRIFPTQHMSHLTTKVAVVVYCIIAGLSFQPERLIHVELCENARKPYGPFNFPALVKLLCNAAGVPPNHQDSVLVSFPKNPINEACLKRMVEHGLRQKRKRASSSAPEPVGRGQVSDLRAQFEKLRLKFDKLAKYVEDTRPCCMAAFKETYPDGEFPELPEGLTADYKADEEDGSVGSDDPIDLDDEDEAHSSDD